MDVIEAVTEKPHLVGLNSAQRLAATHGIPEHERVGSTPPLLIIAGAGSGKTKALTHRVAHLVLNGADPRRILLMTFARRMAAEMTRRVEQICALSFKGRSTVPADAIEWSGTFHAIGAKLLRLHAETIGLDPSFSILDRGDAEDLMDMVRDEQGLSTTRNRFPKKSTCLAIYSFAVNAQTDVRKTLIRAFPWCSEWEEALNKLFAAYVEAKQIQGVLDYDDLLLYWAKMMEIPEVAELVARRFDHVLVDEYQDTNALQATILLGLKPDGQGLTVVGDDAQSIYSFRAATVRNILDFPGAFSPAADIITLDRNYRSTQPILAAANGVIDLASERFTKNLWTERVSAERPQLVSVRDEADQAHYIVEQVLSNREVGTTLKQQAVLFRTSHHSGQLEVELTRRNIPFVKFGGLKFLDSAHVKDLLALLRFVQNPRDRVAGFRLMQLLPGVGPTSAQRVLDAMADKPNPLAALSEIPAPPRSVMTGPPSSARSIPSGKAVLPGPPRSNWRGVGTSRTSTASMKTPPSGRPISCNWSRSRRAIHPASAS